MSQGVNPELSSALHAWQVVGVSLPIDTPAQQVKVLPGNCGMEGLMDKDRFGPTRYNVPHVDDEADVIGDKTQESMLSGKLVHSPFFCDQQKNWGADLHMQAVLRRTLGYHGLRAATHLAYELPFSSTLQHRATVAYFAAKFCVEPDNESPELVLSVWDNGRQYADATELHRLWTQDPIVDLEAPDERRWRAMNQTTVPGQANRIYPAQVLAMTVASVFDGTLTVVSGANRLDVSDVSTEANRQFRVQQQVVEPITGHVVVARMPLLLPGMQKNYDGTITRR